MDELPSGVVEEIDALRTVGKLAGPKNPIAVPKTYKAVIALFHEYLKRVPHNKPLGLYIDSLDQLSDEAADLVRV